MVRLTVALVVVAAACGRDAAGRGQRTTELAACADAIERAGAAAPGEQVEVVARACAAACDGLAGWVAARGATQLRPGVDRAAPGAVPPLVTLVEGCVPGCDAAAATGSVPAGMRWPALLDACGADALGVPRDQPALASDEWIALGQIARWTERSLRAGVADPQLPKRVEHVTVATFALPLPTHPGAPASRFRGPSRARQFVSIDRDLRLGAVPHVRLRGGRLELVAVPGPYPGVLVEPDQVGAMFETQAAALAQEGGAPARHPLVLVDGGARFARVTEVATRLGVEAVELGVRGDVSLAHPVRLERRGAAFARPEIRIEPGGAELTIVGFGDDRRVRWDQLDRELDHFAAVNAPIPAMEIHALPETTVEQVVQVMDACVVARVEALVFVP